ncbi:hypothetical protein KsCSTR_40190 [Candidatus Kuenenia stuttgartiensis]|uniref:Uncharacterized protein n=1 Tax=Kuenenia stuttgartiensis TaxID=174633 RepID=A0A6G7GUY2_KUEST|nr:hypothetical protein KsCSTR_40190 [Candidatus Kuenenia stuttgartiensis]
MREWLRIKYIKLYKPFQKKYLTRSINMGTIPILENNTGVVPVFPNRRS